jgi:hypothetical protein
MSAWNYLMKDVERHETKISYPKQFECKSYGRWSIYILVTAHPIITVQCTHFRTHIFSNGNWFWHLYVQGLLHYRMTLRTAPSDREVRTLSVAFRVDLGTRYVTICGVACCRKEWGERYTMRRMKLGLWGGG